MERQQLKWFAYSVVFAIAVIVAGGFIPGVSEEATNRIGTVVWGVGPALIIASIGLAILRYRLYDIDRLINRTLVYGLVVGLLAVVFVAGTVWIPYLLPTNDSSLAVAASTLAVFFLFQPLRKRVQAWVDRRFYRSRYDSQLVADSLAVQLRDQVDPGMVSREWALAVQTTMQPATMALWVRDGTGSRNGSGTVLE